VTLEFLFNGSLYRLTAVGKSLVDEESVKAG
jgi:hypothetical protein